MVTMNRRMKLREPCEGYAAVKVHSRAKTVERVAAFHTALIATDYHRYPKPPFKGSGWHITFVKPNSEFPIASEVVGEKIYPGKEVLIFAKTEIVAQRAANLIHAARLIVDGSNLLSHLYPGEHAPIYAEERGKSAEGGDNLDFPKSATVVTPGIPLACVIAARASRRLKHIYAMAKLRLSLETFSLPIIGLDPHHSANVPKSPLPEDQVRCAFAIVSAYSCIEELGFEIRASADNPAKVGGSWNPTVRSNLESRLTSAGIDLRERVLWSLGGPRTLIEKKRVPEVVHKATWAKYQVRDGMMEVIDAINYVSFLRSKISAHRADRRLIRVLSVYDVANAQHLARRLLLETMGFWRYWSKPSKKRRSHEP